MVLAAACFHHRTKAEVGMGFLTWMAVAQSYPNMPLWVDRWQCLGIGWLLHDCHYYQASDNGIASSQRQHRNKQDSWRCGDIPSIHNSTGFPILQVMWIQADQSSKWDQLWIAATVSLRLQGWWRCFVVVGKYFGWWWAISEFAVLATGTNAKETPNNIAPEWWRDSKWRFQNTMVTIFCIIPYRSCSAACQLGLG